MNEPEMAGMAEVFTRFEASAIDEQAAVLRERAAAGTLLAALLRLPPEDRERTLHLDPRCHTVSLGRLLLASGSPDPEEREANARLALAIADLLPRSGRSPALTAGLRSSALLHVADALREQGRLIEARAALALVPLELETCGDILDQAGYCLSLGRLRRAQGRIDEALALLARAADLFGDIGEPREERAALVDLGELSLLQHEAGRALAAFERVLRADPAWSGDDLESRAREGAAAASAGTESDPEVWAMQRPGERRE